MAKKKYRDESSDECSEPASAYCETGEALESNHSEYMSTMAFQEMVQIRQALVRLADQHMQTVRHRDLP